MKVGYFPGCSLEGTAVEYNESLLAVAKSLGIELEEVHDWNCCGATAAHSLNKLLSIALPARILAAAEKQGFAELLVPCAACYSRLMNARYEIMLDEVYKKKIPELIEMPFNNTVKPVNIIEFLQKHALPALDGKISKPFETKVACYYGCLLVRPPKLVNAERYEDPQDMEMIMKKIGAEPLAWSFKTECCGAGLSVPRTDIVAKLSGKIIEDATSRGAKAIIVACPMCQSNLDMRRADIVKKMKKEYDIPVLFITQAIGMSMGITDVKLGLQRHIVPVQIKFEKPQPKKAPAKKDTKQMQEAV